LAQYAPIVVLIDVDSRARVRELRARLMPAIKDGGSGKDGAATSARQLVEAAQRLKRTSGHLLTATLDASREEAWFEALRHLIFHLQALFIYFFSSFSIIYDLVID
jgi:hypothetical protein